MKKALKITALVAAGFIVIGLGLSFLGMMLGGSPYIIFARGTNDIFSHRSFTNHSQDVSEFTSVMVKGSYMELEMRPSSTDGWKVESRYTDNINAPLISTNDGVLSITTEDSWKNVRGNAERVITIYYPKDSHFDEVDVSLAAGTLDLSSFSATNLNLDLSAGETTLFMVTTDNADIRAKAGTVDMDYCNLKNTVLDLDAGDLSGEGLVSENLDARLKMGSLDLEGDFTGKTTLDLAMGDVELSLFGKKSDYTIAISSNLGDTEIDGKEECTRYSQEADTENMLDVDMSMGSVEINFMEQ